MAELGRKRLNDMAETPMAETIGNRLVVVCALCSVVQ